MDQLSTGWIALSAILFSSSSCPKNDDPRQIERAALQPVQGGCSREARAYPWRDRNGGYVRHLELPEAFG